MPRNTDPIATSVWLRPPRERRGRGPLSREEIVGAAVKLLDAEGLDGLSMRRLAATLGSGTTSQYFYVSNKDELLELVIDNVMGEIEVPDHAEVGWRAAARDVARGMRAMILRHPWMVGMFGVRPAIGPNAMRLSDRTIAVLAAAGFAAEELAWASSLLMSHAIGSATAESAMRAATTLAGRSATEMVEQLRPYLERVGTDYPAYTAWWHEVGDFDVDRYQEDSFDFGLERLLDGLRLWLDRRDGSAG